MIKNRKTPFQQIREERIKDGLFEYFIKPYYFDEFCTEEALMIYGARGSGKTTLLKALSIEQADDINTYLLDNDYIGVYFRIDLNISSSFEKGGIEDSTWEKLFIYYFVCSLSYELIAQFILINKSYSINEQSNIASFFAKRFNYDSECTSLEGLHDVIGEELFKIRMFINNSAPDRIPAIGDYSFIIQELPKALLKSINRNELGRKIVFFLIDEFEGLSRGQQRQVLSQVKYSDEWHTYKICLRPEGDKTNETVGGEIITESDDFTSIDLTSLYMNQWTKYREYLEKICDRRIQVYANKYNLPELMNVKIRQLLQKTTFESEVSTLNSRIKKIINKEVEQFIQRNKVSDRIVNELGLLKDTYEYLMCNVWLSKHKDKTIADYYNEVQNNTNSIKTFRANYKMAILYNEYLILGERGNRNLCGIDDIIRISGGTVRYLLQICNAIWEEAVYADEFDAENPREIKAETQGHAINAISRHRFMQISNIPIIGNDMRSFILSLGRIFKYHHEDRQIKKIEPNHFSIKSGEQRLNGDVDEFLRQCVMRAVLIKEENNKVKETRRLLQANDYSYRLHPIYVPYFNISWRKKQKLELNMDSLITLISGTPKELDSLMKAYYDDTHEKSKSDLKEENQQITLFKDGE